MKSLNIISKFLLLAKLLLAAGCLFAIAFFTTMENGVFISLGDPHLEISSDELGDKLYRLLPVPESSEPVLLRAKAVDINMQVSTPLKIVLVLLVVVAVLYAGAILEIFQRIVRDVKAGKPFNTRNINRVKLAGLLICIAPLTERAMSSFFEYWIRSRFTFAEMKLESAASLGWSTFIVGLLILVLGTAFDQARQLQEENELTI